MTCECNSAKNDPGWTATLLYHQVLSFVVVQKSNSAQSLSQSRGCSAVRRPRGSQHSNYYCRFPACRIATVLMLMSFAI